MKKLLSLLPVQKFFLFLIISGVMTASQTGKGDNNDSASNSHRAGRVNSQQAEQLIKRWLSIEQQNQALSQTWRQQEPILRQRIALLSKEKEKLQAVIHKEADSQSKVALERAALSQAQTQMETEQKHLKQVLASEIHEIIKLQNQLPPPLSQLWSGITSDSDLSSNDTSVQLSTLLTLLQKLNDFDLRVSSFQTNLVLADGKEIMVDQLYLGLSYAWYTSLDGRYTGRGFPEKNGWRWVADSKVDSEAVKNAIAIIKGQADPDFVRLPFSLFSGESHE